MERIILAQKEAEQQVERERRQGGERERPQPPGFGALHEVQRAWAQRTYVQERYFRYYLIFSVNLYILYYCVVEL
jgi:hypothetical protein